MTIYTKQDRLEHANQLIEIISSHGRRFFFDQKQDRTANIMICDRGRVWFIDDYTGKSIYTHKTGFTNRWRGFSHGGTLRNLVEMMRDYITKGTKIHPFYLGMERQNLANGNIWGYEPDQMDLVRAKAAELPIIAATQQGGAS